MNCCSHHVRRIRVRRVTISLTPRCLHPYVTSCRGIDTNRVAVTIPSHALDDCIIQQVYRANGVMSPIRPTAAVRRSGFTVFHSPNRSITHGTRSARHNSRRANTNTNPRSLCVPQPVTHGSPHSLPTAATCSGVIGSYSQRVRRTRLASLPAAQLRKQPEDLDV